METADPRALFDALRFLTEAIDGKDPYTLGHSDRVARYAVRIAEELPEGQNDEFRERLFLGAYLHDIGKVRVPAQVLLKPGKLGPAEWIEIQLHPVHGVAILSGTQLQGVIGPIIRAHHERLNGSGYPDGLKGDQIPLEARIVAVADVFDACSSKRIYQKGAKSRSDDVALAALRDDAKKGALDPKVVDAFLRACRAGKIHAARAASYCHALDPLVAQAGGERRSLLRVAERIYLSSLADHPDLDLDPVARRRTLVRLATLRNWQGDPKRALAYLDKAKRLAPPPDTADGSLADAKAALQRAIALRDFGAKAQARELATQLLELSPSDHVTAIAGLLVADVLLDAGSVEDAAEAEKRAQDAVQRMSERAARDKERSPIGVALRWWNPSRIRLLEGEIALCRLRRLRRLGARGACDLAAQTAELFESVDHRGRASEARVELARALSDRGQLDRARFLLEREAEFARLQGQTLEELRRRCWLAQTEARCARKMDPGKDRTALFNQARRRLEKRALLRAAKRLDREWIVDFSLAVIAWHEGNLSESTRLSRAVLDGLTHRRADPDPVESDTAPELTARLIMLEAESDPQITAYTALAARAKASLRTTQEVEILACAAARVSRLPEPECSRLPSLVADMGGCWIDLERR